MWKVGGENNSKVAAPNRNLELQRDQNRNRWDS